MVSTLNDFSIVFIVVTWLTWSQLLVANTKQSRQAMDADIVKKESYAVVSTQASPRLGAYDQRHINRVVEIMYSNELSSTYT